MTNFESKIGKTPIKGDRVRNYIIDDPTMPPQNQQENQQENPQELQKESTNIISKLSGEWTKLSSEEYNEMRDQLLNRVTMKSTDDVSENIGETHVDNEDENLLNSFTSKPKEKLPEIKPEIKQENKMKNKIEVLLGLKSKRAYKKIDGHVLCLKNLNSQQTKIVFERINNLKSNFDKIYATKHMVLAFAIHSVDDETMECIFDKEDILDNRMKIIENMDHEAVDELYDFYVKEIQQKINITQDKVEETAGEIKK